MKVETEYNIEEVVFLKTDKEQLPRIVVGVIIRKGTVLLELVHSVDYTTHYDYEVSKNQNILFKIS